LYIGISESLESKICTLRKEFFGFSNSANRTHRTVVPSPENHRRRRPPQKRYFTLILGKTRVQNNQEPVLINCMQFCTNNENSDVPPFFFHLVTCVTLPLVFTTTCPHYYLPSLKRCVRSSAQHLLVEIHIVCLTRALLAGQQLGFR
jgi:hypothetical protein